MAAYNKYNAFVADQNNKVHNLGSDVLKILLSNTLPAAGDSYATAAAGEIAAGNGYSAGGPTVGITSSSQTSGTYKLIASANTVVTASGAVGPFRYAIFYNSTASKLISWWDYGSSITMANGDTFTVSYDAVNGIFNES